MWRKFLKCCNNSGLICLVLGHKWKRLQQKHKYIHKVTVKCERCTITE